MVKNAHKRGGDTNHKLGDIKDGITFSVVRSCLVELHALAYAKLVYVFDLNKHVKIAWAISYIFNEWDDEALLRAGWLAEESHLTPRPIFLIRTLFYLSQL